MAFRAVLDAANRVSAERGPTNAALGRNASGAAARDDRFRSFRRASDDALDAVRRIGPFGTSLAALEERLAAARREVDRLLDRPRAEREPEAVERAIEAMFSAYDAAQPLLDTAMTALLADDPQLVGHAMVARMLGEMRDYAGRHFCPRCGSSVFARSGDEIEVNLGSLDAPDQFVPTYELWTIRREAWLPAFPVRKRYERDRRGTSRSEE